MLVYKRAPRVGWPDGLIVIPSMQLGLMFDDRPPPFRPRKGSVSSRVGSGQSLSAISRKHVQRWARLEVVTQIPLRIPKEAWIKPQTLAWWLLCFLMDLLGLVESKAVRGVDTVKHRTVCHLQCVTMALVEQELMDVNGSYNYHTPTLRHSDIQQISARFSWFWVASALSWLALPLSVQKDCSSHDVRGVGVWLMENGATHHLFRSAGLHEDM